MNLIRYVGNGATNATDPSGLWRIVRNGKAWAIVISEKGDTVVSLARIARFTASEYRKWLRVTGADGLPQSATDELRPGCRYLIPNTFAVFTSSRTGVDKYYPPSWLFGMANRARKMVVTVKDNAEKAGYKVVGYFGSSSPREFKDLWKVDGIAGIAFGGHGVQLDNGDWVGYYVDNENEIAVGPSSVKPPYKLAFILAYHCGSADPIIADNLPIGAPPTMKWVDLISQFGRSVGYEGAVTTVNEGARIRIVDGIKSDKKQNK